MCVAKGVVGLRLVASDAEHREIRMDEMLPHELVDRGEQLSPTEIAERAADHHRARIGALRRRSRHLHRLSRRDDRRAAHECFTAWPPNSLRSAAITFAPNESVCRERNRVCSDSVITGAGTSRSIASCTVQRPSPESATQPLMSLEREVVLERAHRQLVEPRSHDAAVLPHFGDLREIEIRKDLRRVQDLVSLGVRLEQAVLDAVVNHLHVVAGAGRTHVRVAILRRQRGEDRLAVLHRRVAAADHQAVAVLQSPDAAARAAVDELDLRLGELAAAADRVVEVGIAAVDDDVAGGQHGSQRGDRLVDRIAGRHHDPDDARRRERLHDRCEIRRAGRAERLVFRDDRSACGRTPPACDHDESAAPPCSRPFGQGRSSLAASRVLG